MGTAKLRDRSGGSSPRAYPREPSKSGCSGSGLHGRIFSAHTSRPSVFGLCCEPVNQVLLQDLGITEQYSGWEREAQQIGAELSAPAKGKGRRR